MLSLQSDLILIKFWTTIPIVINFDLLASPESIQIHENFFLCNGKLFYVGETVWY